ncbi:MAG TPA: hypothetical protein VGX28_01115, partial [Frankiaceae bacterium]|nr:hypothetical protein [Frankiaceae bacterium]
MFRRLITAAAVAAVAVTASVPSHAAAPVKLYLNELTDSCQNGRVNAITTSPDDSGGCVVIPRVLVDGEGLDNESEAFVSVKGLKSFRIDSSKKLTGTFALFGSSGNSLAPGAANVSAIFTVKIAKKKIGTVTVSGVATPAGPVAQSFSLT